MKNYWVVGATWGGDGKEDQTELFLRRGYWHLGWDEELPNMTDHRKRMLELQHQMKPGDRIAIKKWAGGSSSQNKDIIIKALGIIKDTDEERVYVDWILVDLNRIVPHRLILSLELSK